MLRAQGRFVQLAIFTWLNKYQEWHAVLNIHAFSSLWIML